MIKREQINVIYQDHDILMGETEGRQYLFKGENYYRLSDYPFEHCLYIKSFDGINKVIHHAFTVEELFRAAQTDGCIRMITGDEYGIRDIIKLIFKAIELPMESMDLSYVEGQCFIDYMKERGAVSPETAVDPADVGITNPNVMNPFLHSKKVSRTSDALFYLRSPKGQNDQQAGGNDRYSRVISNQVRFGYGYRQHGGRKQYYAWHGYPNRNDDFITYAEITWAEFVQIEKEYPFEIEADRETAEKFRNKYVDGHPMIKQGWNVSLRPSD